MLKILKNKIRILDYFLLFLFCFVPLIYTLFNNFIGDDFCWLYQAKEAIKNGNIFNTISEPSPYGYFRPLSSFLFTTFYYFAGSEVLYYRILSILLHYANSVLIYILVCRLNYDRKISLISGILFSVIAVHAETVLNISSFNILLASLFISFILIFYTGVRYLKQYFILSLLVFMLMFIRESNVTIIFLILVISFWQKRRDYIKVLLYSSLPILLYFIIRYFWEINLIESASTERYGAFWEHLHPLKILYTIPHYIISTVLPVKLLLSLLNDEMFSLLKKSFNNPSDNIFIFSILFSSAIFISTLILFIIFKKMRKEILFPLLFFLASIIIYIPLYQTSERFVYYASAGICIILAIFFNRLKLGKTAIVLFTVIHLLGFVYGMHRWKNAEEYYRNMPFEIHSVLHPFENSTKILILNFPTSFEGSEIISTENFNKTMDYYFPEFNKKFLLAKDTSSVKEIYDIVLIYNKSDRKFQIKNQ
jgi:hypothetical protein